MMGAKATVVETAELGLIRVLDVGIAGVPAHLVGTFES